MLENIDNANGGVNGGVNFGTTEIKKHIVDLMAKNPEISAEQISKIIKTSKRRVEYNISRLKETGIVERIGPDKTGHWVVKVRE